MEPFQLPITCQLCSQPYTDPRMLSCFHSFCRECLHKEVERISVQQDGAEEGSQLDTEEEGSQLDSEEEGSQLDGEEEGSQQNVVGMELKKGVMCPTCNKSVSIPWGGVRYLPQNLHLDAEVKVAQYQSKIASNHKVPCDACIDDSSGPAVGYCCECLKFLCQLCCDHHKRARDLHLHNVLPLGTKVDRELLSAIKPSCSSHHKEFIIYCETCSCLICQDCITSDHRDHTHDTKLPNIAKSHRDDISKLLVSAEEVMKNLTGAIDDNNEALEQVEVCEETVSSTIRETFKKLHQTLEDRMNEILRELHEDSLSKKTALGLQKENFEALKQNLSHCTGIASSVLTYTGCEIIALKQLPSKELQASIKTVKKMSLIPCENSDIETAMQLDLYHKNVLEVFSLFDSVCPAKSSWKLSTSHPITNASFSVVVEAKDSKERLYQCNDIQVKAELTAAPDTNRITLWHQAAVPSQIGQVSSNSNGTYTITFTPSTAGCHKLSITIDGQHIKDSPKSVTVNYISCISVR